MSRFLFIYIYIYIYICFIQRKNSETNIYAIQKQSWSLGVVFSENDVLKYFVKFTRKHLCQSLKVFKNFFLEHLRTAAYSSQKHIENPVKHQREAFCRKCWWLQGIKYFHKMLYLRCFAGFWICLCSQGVIQGNNLVIGRDKHSKPSKAC